MMLLNVLIAYVAVISSQQLMSSSSYIKPFDSYLPKDDCGQPIEELTPEQEGLLVEKYTLTQSPKHYANAKIWNTTDGTRGQLLIFKHEYCGKWTQYSVDRFYHWHEGEATIDIIDPEGNYVPNFMGSSRLDAVQNYVVHVPAGWYSNIKIPRNFAIFTSVLVNYQPGGAKLMDISDMYKMFGQMKAIEETGICYE